MGQEHSFIPLHPSIKGADVVPSNTFEFVYDGNGMRVRQSIVNSQQSIVYHYDEMGNVLQETDGEGNLIASYIYANGQRN